MTITDRVNQTELARRLAAHMGTHAKTADLWIDGLTETLYECFKKSESVTIKGFGNFYIREERSRWVFKFNPAQRLRALLGWSSTYNGPL
jgi:DNA-binding protein HU-beta